MMTKAEVSTQKRVALITGGASGLGFATAKRLVRDGVCVALADIKADQLAKAAATLAMPDDRVRTYVLDVTDPAAVQRVTAQVHADYGHIDILVTSAGISYQGTVLDNPLEAWNRVIGINLTGSYLCAQAAARFMAERRKGHIVMLASITGQQVWSGRVAYAASKGGVLALAKSCAIDLAPYGITVNSVSPGPIRTPQTASLHNQVIQDAIRNATPMARYGEPDEVADAIAFLASDDSRFVTGHDLVVDGGLTSAAILYDLKSNPLRN
jgi:3-oxoacyl-[acyl-carrier protein] reductase